MPLYEYNCRKCGARFEFLVLKKQDVPTCPNCGSRRNERRMSSCSIQGTVRGSDSSCSSCSLPSCSSCGTSGKS